MMRWLRRFFWLGLLVGVGYSAYRALAARQSGPASAPHWSPASSSPSQARGASEAPARWVLPVDGLCPDGYPIKANESSGIYHVPGGRFYERTSPDRCYANAEDAVADGYRPAKA
ncbi:MAG: sunset domain-containing protein [Mycobacterium sp.]